jgi:crotonobetainyl-CoA:carnitine CoA-transferase CaiB-like acyl-CoA transferase
VSAPLALAGVRVLDAATNIAGPYGASLLADIGAEVIKIEPLAGDPMRAYPPFCDGTTTQFAAVNHGKRYLAIDLRTVGGRALLHELAAGADVLVQNARAGHEAKLGLDAEACHAANPRLIHATVAAFHPADGDRPGYDMLVQGESGLLDQTGEPNRPPSRIGASAIDHATGLWLAFAVMAALRGPRDRETIRVSMLDVAVGLLNEKASAYIATGEAPQRMGAGTSVTTPHGAFATADGHIVIGAATDAAFIRLARVLGPPLEGDERFLTQAGRLAHREEVESAVTAALGHHTSEHWAELLSANGLAVGRVATLPEAIERHRGDSSTGLRAVEGSDRIEVLAPAASFHGEQWGPLPLPGGPGSDSDAVLATIGVAPKRRAELRDQGIIP